MPYNSGIISMPSLGQELKQARQRAAMSVAEIARQTKISARLLQSLEDERFDLMPEPFFVKGVLKAYVRAVGADEARFLDLYREIFPPSGPAREAPAAAPVKERGSRPSAQSARIHRPELQDFRAAAGRSGQMRRRGPRLRPWVLAILVVLLLGAATGLVLLYIQSRSKPAPTLPSARPEVQAPIRAEPPPEASIGAPSGQPAGSAAGPAAGSPAGGSAPGAGAPAAENLPADAPPSFADGLKLELRFKADTWIQVAADGRVVLDGIQAAGRAADLSADREFVIQVGNAGGVDYLLNGRPGIPFGGAGAVKTDIRINRDTAAAFLRRGPEPGPAPEPAP